MTERNSTLTAAYARAHEDTLRAMRDLQLAAWIAASHIAAFALLVGAL